MICPLENKLDLLFSFLKMKRRKKVIVFVASCKQVKRVEQREKERETQQCKREQ